MDNWDFDCPQFVDFAAALDEDVFNDATSDLQETAISGSDNVGPRMATPKVKPNDPVTNLCFSTDDEKLANLNKLPARLSKSDVHLDQIFQAMKSPDAKECPKLCKTNRRSSFPMNNIKKRKPLAITPECLKRTLNSKSKIGKTSEELELQKIAEMRNMLQKHLRLNKINLKRLKMNKAPFTLEKLPKKIEPKAPAIKSKSNLMAVPKPAPKFERNLHLGHNVASCSKAFSQGIKGVVKVLQTEENPVFAKKTAPSNVLRDLNVLKKDCGIALKKPLFEKHYAHTGIQFLPHQEKTALCPFSFDSSFASSHNASNRAANRSKVKKSLSVSQSGSSISDNKENLKK